MWKKRGKKGLFGELRGIFERDFMKFAGGDFDG